MILVCPLCQTRFLVSAHAFAQGPRQVRCGRCKHGWQVEIELPLDHPLPSHEPESPRPIPQGSNLPKKIDTPLDILWKHTRAWVFALVFLVFLIWMVEDRQELGRRYSFLEPVYKALDLSIYYPGEELEFEEVRSELKYDSGLTKLVLTGKIINSTKKSQKVPDIVAEALGANGHVLQSWQIDAPKATLAPGEEVPFESTITAPKGNVVNVNLNFTEDKDDK